MPSVLTDAPFTKTTLTYSVATGEWETDENGNQVPKTTSGTLSVIFAPYRFDQLRFRPGADPQVVPGRGELIDPFAFPEGVTVGATMTCTYAGRDWNLKLTNIIPNDIPDVEFGSFFTADMTPA